MTSLYVDRRDVLLKHDAGAIVFYENGQRSATVPLAPLTRLILRGKVTLEAGLLGQLGQRGVGVLFLSGRNGDPHLLLGPGHNDIQRRVVQVRLSLDSHFCLSYANALVQEKIQTQINSLDELRQFSDQIEQDVFAVLTLEGSVNARNHVGGTAPAQVKTAVVRGQQLLASR